MNEVVSLERGRFKTYYLVQQFSYMKQGKYIDENKYIQRGKYIVRVVMD